MGNRLTKIYTRTGDNGTTGLGNNTRVPKYDERVIAMGDIDELNSHIGLIKSFTDNFSKDKTFIKVHSEKLSFIQHRLFDLGGELCIPGFKLLEKNHTEKLEKEIDEMNEDLSALKEFILPAGHIATSQCHVARTVCRRAERSCVKLNLNQEMNDNSLKFINRLSDWLFTFARILNKENSVEEVFWKKGS